MGLTIMIAIQVLLWFAGFFVKGMSLYQILLIVPVSMFSFRKFGVKISSIHIVVVEILFLFFSTVMTLLFSSIDTPRYIINLLFRVISVIIAIIDDTLYVYVTEERKIK